MRCAASVIVAHNHPSGDPAPSSEDIEVTKRLVESGKIIGIDVLDHVIIGDNKFTSLKEKGYL
ncbi:JAB domain-containing protein [Bacillaceae bacterium CLA-AA-H227]|uniref:JAB domain-containing protein n=1 Tax=Robertmurraya yapensis (ex Hitch et al 2024) TaxID=3133160 RepID=A0ACC6SC83_9BACI|nr:JAB domain-containing protein [Robertmurraya kyonggiensis]